MEVLIANPFNKYIKPNEMEESEDSSVFYNIENESWTNL